MIEEGENFQSKALLDSFVFLIIPLLNPDGVYKGHYRTDDQGLNLNRFYVNPNHIDHPSIYGAKQIALSLGKRFHLYIDLHAHASKKGCFIFGNALDFASQVENCVFPKLLSMNCKAFDYEGCDFSQKNMFSKDKGDEFSKEGSGRVAIYRATSLIHCYTLECNYNTGNYSNNLDFNKNDNDNSIDYDNFDTIDIFINNRKKEKNESIPYGIEAYQEIGQAICLSLLDFNEINPYSRIENSNFKKIKVFFF